MSNDNAPSPDDARRHVLSTYANSLNRALMGALAAHVPGDSVSAAVREATRVMAVAVMANRLKHLIDAAEDRDGKGGRRHLRRIARDVMEGRT